MNRNVGIIDNRTNQTDELCVNCPLNKICDIKRLESFLGKGMPIEVFKLFKENNCFDAVRLSNKISEHQISLLRLKNSSFKDLYFSKRKFPIEVFPAIEYLIYAANTGFLKWGFWIRNLAVSGYKCEDFNRRTELSFLSITSVIQNNLPKLLTKGENVVDLFQELMITKHTDLKEELNVEQKVDYYDILNTFFGHLFDYCDIATYIIVSYSLLVNNKDKIVYVSPAILKFLDKYLDFFLNKMPSKGFNPTEICVTTPHIKGIVESAINNINVSVPITLC